VVEFESVAVVVIGFAVAVLAYFQDFAGSLLALNIDSNFPSSSFELQHQHMHSSAFDLEELHNIEPLPLHSKKPLR